MDTQATQHRQQIAQTRTAMTAKLDLLEQHLSQKVAATVEQTMVAPVRGLLWTATKSTTLLQQYPWLIIVGGALFGYQLSGSNTQLIRPAQSPPQRTTGGPPTVPPTTARHASGLRLAAAAAHTSSGPAGAGGTHGGGHRLTHVRPPGSSGA